MSLFFPLIPKLPVALRLMSQWRFNDVRVTKNWILRILDDNRQNSNSRQKMLGISNFDVFFFFFFFFFFFAYYKRKSLFLHIQEVSSTKQQYFCLRSKSRYLKVATPPLPLTLTAYPTPTPGWGNKHFCDKMT